MRIKPLLIALVLALSASPALADRWHGGHRGGWSHHGGHGGGWHRGGWHRGGGWRHSGWYGGHRRYYSRPRVIVHFGSYYPSYYAGYYDPWYYGGYQPYYRYHRHSRHCRHRW